MRRAFCLLRGATRPGSSAAWRRWLSSDTDPKTELAPFEEGAAFEERRPFEEAALPPIDESFVDLLQPPHPPERWRAKSTPRPPAFVDFRFLTSWEEVERLVKAIGESFSRYHAAAAFARLRYLPRPSSPQFYHVLVAKTAPFLGAMNAPQLLSIIFSILRLEVDGSAFLEKLAGRLMDLGGQPFRVGTSQLTSTVFALGMAKRRSAWRVSAPEEPYWVFPSEERFLHFAKEMLRTGSHMQRLSEMDCVRVFFTLAQFRHAVQEEQPFIHELCECLVRPQMLHRLNEQFTILIFNSLSALGVNHTLLNERLSREIVKVGSLATFQTSELVTLVGTLGKMQYWNRELILMILDELLKPERRRTMAEQPLVNLIAGIARQPEIRSLDLERYVLPLFADAASHHRLANYIREQLTSILYSAGQLEFPSAKHEGVLVPVLEELVKPETLTAVSSQGLGTALWGVGKVGLKRPECVDRLLEEVVKPERLRKSVNHGLALAVYSCGLLQHQHGVALCRILEEVGRPERIQSLTDRDIAHLAYGIGRTRCVPLSLAAPVIQEGLKADRLVRQATRHLSNLLQMATALEYRNMDDLQRILNEIIKPERMEAMSPLGLHEALIAIRRNTFLTQLPDARVLFLKALEPDLLKVTKTPQLSSLATFLSMHQPSLKVARELLEAYWNEVTRPERIQQFNPIDLTSVYNALVFTGCRDEAKLHCLLDALDGKPSSPARRINQFLVALSNTKKITAAELRSALTAKLLDHISQPQNAALYGAADAFAVVNLLLKMNVTNAQRPKWRQGLQCFVQIAQADTLEAVSTEILVRTLRSASRQRFHLPYDEDFGSWLLSLACEGGRVRRASGAVLVSLVETVATFGLVSPEERHDALKALERVLHRTNKLDGLTSHDALRVIALLSRPPKDPLEKSPTLDQDSLESPVLHLGGNVYGLARQLEVAGGWSED